MGNQQPSRSVQAAMFAELQSQQLVHFDEAELRLLYAKFERLGGGGLVTREQFRGLLAGTTFSKDSAFVQRMVEVFDSDHNGGIDFKEFATGMSLFCRGSAEEIARFAVQCYDLNGDGGISKAEMTQGLLGIALTLQATLRGVLLGQLRRPTSAAAAAAPAPEEANIEREVALFVDNAFAEFDADHDGLLSETEFLAAVRAHPLLVAFFRVQQQQLQQKQ